MKVVIKGPIVRLLPYNIVREWTIFSIYFLCCLAVPFEEKRGANMQHFHRFTQTRGCVGEL
jgi:hypothetical protein